LENFGRHQAHLEEAEELITLGELENEESLSSDIAQELNAAQVGIERMEFTRMLGGPHDQVDAILTVNPGAGGTDSQDWAGMLLRMYVRFCERQGWKIEYLDRQDADEAGIKSATVSVQGDYAYGMLKGEAGVHRLVRISPFDAAARRHTAFAACFVYPDLDDDVEVEIKDSDLRLDTYRASGAGGQHVNKTDSAIRITHLPSGIVVQCQAERSQHKNKAKAMKMLKARLYELEMSVRDEERQAVESSKQAINFGSQVRNYVMHPYRLVKDVRSNYETGNLDAVLDGDLQGFITAYLIGQPD
jgi:peptide chain release factor 2